MCRYLIQTFNLNEKKKVGIDQLHILDGVGFSQTHLFFLLNFLMAQIIRAGPRVGLARPSAVASVGKPSVLMSFFVFLSHPFSSSKEAVKAMSQ